MCVYFLKLDQPCEPCRVKAFRKTDRYLDISPHFRLAHGVNTCYDNV